MDPELSKIIQGGGVATILGYMVWVFLKFFTQQLTSRETRDNSQYDEDRKWIREIGNNQMVVLNQALDIIKKQGEYIQELNKK